MFVVKQDTDSSEIEDATRRKVPISGPRDEE
jgi:hypothetical protein